MTVENRLYTVLFLPDRRRHIAVRPELCARCVERWCTHVCPAGCYTYVEGKMEFAYEGCLECGTCLKVCDNAAIDWKYPRGGFGAHFRYG